MKFHPTRDRYRVIIIDEVNMLSREAFKDYLSNVISQVMLDPATLEWQINYRIGINLGDKMASPRGVELIPRIVIMSKLIIIL